MCRVGCTDINNANDRNNVLSAILFRYNEINIQIFPLAAFLDSFRRLIMYV